jgi:bacterioferritin
MALLDVLNDLRARELGVIMQYMRHHYLAAGPDGVALAGEFKAIAIVEMKHAEALAERIDYLGGDPTTKPDTIAGMSAKTIAEMAGADRDSEADAIARYKEAVKVADAADDVTTRKLLEDILGDEEDHHKTFSDMLG